jgi:beta-galactosidase
MNYKIGLFISILLLFSVTATYARKGRAVENFDFGWKFHLGDVQDAKDVAFDDAGWRDIQLPHDFSIEQEPEVKGGGASGFFPGGIGWYRKTFAAPDGYAGKKVYICFDGVYHRSDVWLNGQHLGFRPYGFVSFEYDLTPYLVPGGNNVLSVRVDHSNSPSARWYSGSGIYRHVRLKALDPVHVDLWGVSVATPRISPEEGLVQLETTIRNDAKGRRQVKLLTEIFSADGKKVGTATQTIVIDPDSADTFKQDIIVKQPVLWDPDSPVLYTVVTKVKAGPSADEVRTNFGFRTLQWDSNKGFFLNGRNMKLKGVNLHHDGGIAVGSAVPERIWHLRLKRLKDIGCNFIRTSHNPPAPEFLDMCDSIGLLVLDEAFDKWKGGKYKDYYDEWWKADLQSMLQRDRNHPSIILWSVGNEVDEQKTEEGAERLEMMVDFVHKYEPSRKVTAGMFPTSHEHNTHGFADKTDIAGYNYNEPVFAIDRKAYPDRIFLGTENFLYYRGGQGTNVYYDDRKHFWNDVKENDWIVGWTLWAGIDYIGESNRIDLKGWPTGFLNSSSSEKTIAGLFRAFWKDTPELNLAVLDDGLDIDPGSLRWSSPKMIAHWNFPQYGNRLIRVQAFSNCDSVALWVNKTSLGKRALADYANNTVNWNVPYEKGKLRAVGYKDGKEAVIRELNTAGEPESISLNSVYPSVKADGQDVALIEVSLKDSVGNIVQHVDRKITYSIEGGTLLGIDNGDLRIREPHRAGSMSTYFGHCLVVVRAGKTAGDIVISAESEGLPAVSLTVPAVAVKPKI